MPKMRANSNARRLPFKETVRIFGRLMKRMFKGYPLHIVSAVICILISSGVGVIGNLFVGRVLVDGFITPMVKGWETGIPSFSQPIVPDNPTPIAIPMNLGTGVLIMMGIYLLGAITAYAYQVLVSIVGQGTQKKIRDELFEHMETLPLSYFDSRTHGDIMSVYTNDIDTLRELISRVLPMVVQSLITMVAALVAMLLSNLLLTAVVLSFFLIVLFVVTLVTRKSSRFYIGQQRSLGQTNGYIEEMISGQKVIKVFNHEPESKKGFDTLNDQLCVYTTKASQFSNILGPIVNNIGNLQYVVLALIGGLSIAYGVGSMTAGTIISFLSLGKSFTMPIIQLSMNINMLIMAMAGAQRIFELLDAESEKDEGYVTLVNALEDEQGNPVESEKYTGKWAWKHPHGDGSVSYSWLRGNIVMEHVDFSYVEGKRVLHDVSLYAKPGQKVAFVGPTGAGKTTITNLLNRFYDIDDGKIRFDDINISKIKKHDLRKAMGMVLQETNLFTGTVRENIRYGNPMATDEEVEAAAKLANADNFIRMMPQGYDTVLKGAGAGLSQGQRQLISIARAACANPPVLILDEATSSIDSRTEQLVQAGMDAIMQGRTVFVIAHRLSTIQNAKAIMVLQNGEIIERGDHEELLKQKGKYYELYTGGKVTEE